MIFSFDVSFNLFFAYLHFTCIAGLPPQAHICQLCFKLFPNPTALETHFQTEHTKEAANRSTPHSSGSGGGGASSCNVASIETDTSNVADNGQVVTVEDKNVNAAAISNKDNSCDGSDAAEAPLYDNKVSRYLIVMIKNVKKTAMVIYRVNLFLIYTRFSSILLIGVSLLPSVPVIINISMFCPLNHNPRIFHVKFLMITHI